MYAFSWIHLNTVKIQKTSIGITCTKFKTVVTFGGERRSNGNGIGIGFSSICYVLFFGENKEYPEEIMAKQ